MRQSYTIASTVVGAIPVAAQETVTDALDLEVLTFTHPTWPHRVPIESAVVIVEFTVQPDGTTQNIVVVKSEPTNGFDRSVAAAVATRRYKPIQQAVRVTQRFEVKDISLR